jgi:hypothetical protein
MNSRREARLHLPANQRESSRSAASQRLAPLVHQLAAQHGIALTADPGLLEWLTQANVPSQLDSSACAAIATVVQQLYALSSPGGGDDGAR